MTIEAEAAPVAEEGVGMGSQAKGSTAISQPSATLGGFAALNRTPMPGNKLVGNERSAVGHGQREGAGARKSDEESNWAREAEESAVRLKVENAMKHARRGEAAKAKEVFEEVLRRRLKSESGAGAVGANRQRSDYVMESGKVINQLRFVAASNLAKILVGESKNAPGDEGLLLKQRALDLYVDAVGFDSGAVVVWHHLGSLALETGNLVLARFAFSQGLLLSPTHRVLLAKYFDLCVSIGDNCNATAAARRLAAVDPSHLGARSWLLGTLPGGSKSRVRLGAGDVTRSASEEIGIETIKASCGSVEGLLCGLTDVWDANQKLENGLSYVRIEFDEVEEEEEVVVVRVEEAEDVVMTDPSALEAKEEPPNAAQEAAKETPKAEDQQEDKVGGAAGEGDKKRKKADEGEGSKEQPAARRSRRVRTLQKEKLEREKAEIQKVAEEIVTMTRPEDYRKRLESAASRLEEVSARRGPAADAAPTAEASSPSKPKPSNVEEIAFLRGHAASHPGATPVGAAIANLVSSLGSGDTPSRLAGALRGDGLQRALLRAFGALRYEQRDVGVEARMLLLEIYLDRIVDERQRSRKTKPAAGVWEGQEAAERAVRALAEGLSADMVLWGDRGSPLIARYCWNQARFLRWGKERAEEASGHFETLKGILRPMDAEAEPRIIHFPWIRHENRVSLAIVEQMSLCSGNVIDAALQRTKALVREDRWADIVADLAGVIKKVDEKASLPLQTHEVLEDKSNHAILQLLMDSAEKCSHRSRADLLCALRILLAVFASGSEDGEASIPTLLPSILSAHVRKCVAVLARSMMAEEREEEDSWGKIGLDAVVSELQFIKHGFRGLLLRCYRELYAKQGSLKPAGKLESPHSCRNQLVDAAVGLCALSELQARASMARREGEGEAPDMATQLDSDLAGALSAVHGLVVEVHAHGVRDGFYLDYALNRLRSLRKRAGADVDAGTKIDASAKLMAFSLYGVDLGLEDPPRHVSDRPGELKLSSRRACRDVWRLVRGRAAIDVQTLEHFVRDLSLHYEDLPGTLTCENFLEEVLKDAEVSCHNRDQLVLALQTVIDRKNAAMAMANLCEEDVSIHDNVFGLLVDSTAEDATLRDCKTYPGHAITPEGHRDIRMESGPFSRHILAHPTDAQAWLNLAYFLDQAKDLIQNDAAKLIRPQVSGGACTKPLLQANLEMMRTLRERIRGTLLVADRLSEGSEDKKLRTNVLDLLSLCMYDAVQNVPPEYGQDKASPVYRTSLEAAKRAFSELAAQRPGDWRLFQGLGKAREKLGEHELALADYSRAVELSGSKLLEPLHRMRASRLKRLVATYVSGDLTVLDAIHTAIAELEKQKDYPPSRYRVAHALFTIDECGRALEAIEPLFSAGKSGGFRINMWEDECLAHGREESSRKLVCRVRKALSLYIKCLVAAKDIQRTNAMHVYLSRSRGWGQCLSDLPLIHCLFRDSQIVQ